MYVFKILLIFILSFLINSCASYFFPELEVKNCWYDTEKIVVKFSDKPTSVSVYDSFVLLEDGEIKNGIYSFLDDIIIFYPRDGIQRGYNYLFTISTTCETSNGNSLADKFIFNFSTKTESIAPSIISISGIDGLKNNEQPEYIGIKFSEMIDFSSFEKALSFSPKFDYYLELSEQEDFVKIYPKNNLEFNTDYKISISKDLKDKNHNNLLHDYSSIFSLIKNYEIPTFRCTVYNGKNYKCECELNKSLELVPTDSRLRFDFDKEMDFSMLSSYIKITPTITFSLEKDEINSRYFEVIFKEPVWGKTYEVRILNKLADSFSNKILEDAKYYICFNNESYRLPEFIEGYIQTGDWSDGDISETDYQIISDATNYSYIVFDPTIFKVDTDCKCFLYLVFSSSKNSNGLNLYSVMDKLSISSTNKTSDFVIKKVSILSSEEEQSYPFINIKDAKLEDSLLNLTVVKYELEMTNSINSGLIQIKIDSGFEDSLGNSSIKSYIYKYNK